MCVNLSRMVLFRYFISIGSYIYNKVLFFYFDGFIFSRYFSLLFLFSLFLDRASSEKYVSVCPQFK